MRPITSFIRRHYTDRELIVMGIAFLAITLSSQIAHAVYTPPAIFQPAAGIALAVLMLEGIALWPAILAGLLLFMAANDAPFLIALGISLGHVVHAITAVFILQKLGFDPIFRRIRDMFAFLIVSLTVSWIVPVFGILSIQTHGLMMGQAVEVTWIAWWLGTSLSNVIIGAFLMRWFAKPTFVRTKWKTFEIVSALSLLMGLSYLLFWNDTSAYGGLAIVFYILPFVWFVLSVGMRFTLLAFFLTTIVGISGIMYGFMPEGGSLSTRFIATEIFLLALAAIFYPFAAVVEERTRAARDLNAQLDRIKALLSKVQSEDRAKNEFLAVFSHELRNPLAPIVSSLEYLKIRGLPDAESTRIVEGIDERVKTITRLLDDLLDISRISRKTFKLRREILDVREVVRKSVRGMQEQATHKSIVFSSSFPDHDVVLNADPVRIEQVMLNLLSNAIKYTPAGGRVHVRLESDDAHAIIYVRDNGIGIKSEMLRRIFEPFLQLKTDHQHRSVSEGLGIGLSLTEKLVLMHGGRIEAKSEGEGRGSEFVVHIPLAPITSTAVSATSHLKTPLKVLVVDDNETAGYALGQILTDQGHRVEYATSGVEAIQKTIESKPQGIIADLGLPDMDGYALARTLREDENYGGLLIALFSSDTDKDVRKIKSVGFDRYITRPVEPEHVRIALRD